MFASVMYGMAEYQYRCIWKKISKSCLSEENRHGSRPFWKIIKNETNNALNKIPVEGSTHDMVYSLGNNKSKYELGGRFPLSLTLPNIWGNTKGKYSPGIYPGINSGICLLRDPRIMTFTLNLSEG